MEAPSHEYFGLLTTHRGLSSHSWSQLLRSFPISGFSFHVVSSQLLFFSFIFPLLHLPLFPSFFYPLFSPFIVTILSHISMISGLVSWRFAGVGLVDLHLHPLSHVISSLLHLEIFQFGVRGFKPSSSKFCDLHFAPQVP
jgi:hypothetical protein